MSFTDRIEYVDCSYRKSQQLQTHTHSHRGAKLFLHGFVLVAITFGRIHCSYAPITV